MPEAPASPAVAALSDAWVGTLSELLSDPGLAERHAAAWAEDPTPDDVIAERVAAFEELVRWLEARADAGDEAAAGADETPTAAGVGSGEPLRADARGGGGAVDALPTTGSSAADAVSRKVYETVELDAVELLEVANQVADAVAPPPPAPEELDAQETDAAEVDALEPAAAAAGPPAPAPPPPDADMPPPLVEPDPLAARAAELLYDDILWLFSINDFEAALISLERLLVLSQLDGEILEFVQLNEDKLLNLYEGYLGPFDKVPEPLSLAGGAKMPKQYMGFERIAEMRQLVDGRRTIRTILDTAGQQRLVACAALVQLYRSGVVTF